jgi:Protein of unknown function (DUF4238)
MSRLGAIAQLEERLHGMQEVVGSSPTSSISSWTCASWWSNRGAPSQSTRGAIIDSTRPSPHPVARLRLPSMSDPKLHHYVPQFYLRRFSDTFDRLWAWDRDMDRVFITSPRSVAAERSFYYLDVLAEHGHDPLTMEKQFASLEHETACITSQWIEWIRDGSLGMQIPIPDQNRAVVALFIALQFLRTADSRDVLARFASTTGYTASSKHERRLLHTEALWNDSLIDEFRNRVESASWVFGWNTTDVPFMTSDNPVAFRRGDNAMWLKIGMFGAGTYVVYPLAPDIVMYCLPPEEPWLKVASLDSSLSPIAFTTEMVESENSAQAFMASRFVLSCKDDFAMVREFAATIGTDVYAPHWRTN